MTKWPRFGNAPIVEALLDVRATFPAPIEPGRLESFQDAIRDRYPTKMGRIAWESEIQVRQEAVQQAITRRGPEGFMFKARDGRRTVQARQDGFTFNWLKPYDRWETFRDEAREHWERNKAMFRPEAVSRIALRYVNRLELPVPFDDFREYVKTAPDIAPELPQGLNAFFMRLEIPDEQRGLVAILTETIEPLVNEGKRLPFILDIDVIYGGAIHPDSSAMWDKFEELREFKNEIFFSSVTERAKELFQ